MKSPRARKAEIREALEEQAYWEEIGKYLPWRVRGWSRKTSASYITGAVKQMPGRSDDAHLWNALVLPRLMENQGSLVELTGEQRDQIVAAFKAGRSGR